MSSIALKSAKDKSKETQMNIEGTTGALLLIIGLGLVWVGLGVNVTVVSGSIIAILGALIYIGALISEIKR